MNMICPVNMKGVTDFTNASLQVKTHMASVIISAPRAFCDNGISVFSPHPAE
jgi:hypothetical protein